MTETVSEAASAEDKQETQKVKPVVNTDTIKAKAVPNGSMEGESQIALTSL